MAERRKPCAPGEAARFRAQLHTANAKLSVLADIAVTLPRPFRLAPLSWLILLSFWIVVSKARVAGVVAAHVLLLAVAVLVEASRG